MNVHIYPRESECYSESLKTVENAHPPALSSKERTRKRGAGTSLLPPQPCNGIASGKRMETDGTLYPSNHDRIRPASTTSPLLADERGTWFPGDASFSPDAIQHRVGYTTALSSPVSFFNWLKGVNDSGRVGFMGSTGRLSINSPRWCFGFLQALHKQQPSRQS